MSGPGSNPFANNRHADVLNEFPADDVGKLRLVEEVKNRAKGAFAQKDMPSAELLYGKAISLLEGMPDKQEAALHSNRSMVRLNLNKVEDALADAKKCIELDPKFVKGYFRKSVALCRLNEWDDAILAAEAGAALEPDNKSFQEAIEKAQKAKAEDAEDKAKLKRDAQDVRVELHNASTARAPPVKKEKKDGEENSELRGYKKTADGRTTSYFHTEISDEAKALIAAQGFGKPQRLEGGAVEGPVDVKGGGSQWNQAGTYEEKNMIKWVEEALKQRLVGISFQLPTGGTDAITTTAVENVKGDASISVSRGKRRYILEVAFDVAYEGKVGDASGKGKYAITEVTTMADESPEVNMEIDSGAPPPVREVFTAFAKLSGHGLQPLVMAEVSKVIEEYKTK